MLRTLIFALALAAPGLAVAEQFPRAVVGAEVRADDGTVIGRVTAVERDRAGNVVAVAIPGLEPPDAASVQPRVFARAEPQLRVLVIDRRDRRRDQDRGGSAERARLR